MIADLSELAGVAPNPGPQPLRDMTSPARLRLGRHRVVAGVLLAAVAVLATRESWADVVRIALRDEEQSHVFLVPVVAAWLVWVRRRRLRRCPVGETWAGPALAALGAALVVIGDWNLLQSLWHFGALLVVVGAFVSAAGSGVLVRFLPAFAALAFLVPMPAGVREAVALPLQTASAAATQAAIDLIGVPVERWGNTLRVDGRDIAIAEACNGMRMVFALFLVTFAFVYGSPLRNGVRVAILVASPLIAVAANVVRLAVTVIAYGRLPEAAAATIHDVTGWLLPLVALLGLFALLRLLHWSRIPVTPHAPAYGA